LLDSNRIAGFRRTGIVKEQDRSLSADRYLPDQAIVGISNGAPDD
jgi:hypothetical protein